MQDYTALERSLSYHFNNPILLEHALIHSSYASEHGLEYVENNERFEFIGDAYLDAVIGFKLFHLMESRPEGILSKTRANIVCEESLASIARQIHLGDYLQLGHGEELHGGRDKSSILADAVEAIIGAIMMDSGYDTCEQVVLNLFKENIELALSGKLHHDYKSALQEKLQAEYKSARITYPLVEESGPDHQKTFCVQVVVNDKVLATGTGHSKKAAEQDAAKEALTKGDC